jgi:NAD(P)-dependent dehydrogenase (short-subunit alcohol dehydrogenase family)
MRIVDLPITDWDRALDANCSSLFYLARLLLPSMTERGWGRIVAIGGTAATRPGPLYGPVAASKAGMIALVKVIAAEAGAGGVTANVLGLAVTETTPIAVNEPERLKTLLPIPRGARFDEIAGVCAFLASDEAAYITGQVVRVDGGLEL